MTCYTLRFITSESQSFASISPGTAIVCTHVSYAYYTPTIAMVNSSVGFIKVCEKNTSFDKTILTTASVSSSVRTSANVFYGCTRTRVKYFVFTREITHYTILLNISHYKISKGLPSVTRRVIKRVLF